MAIDIFGEWGTIIGQILVLISIGGLIIQTARWSEKKHVTRDWYFFVLIIVAVIATEGIAIYRFDAQQTALSNIEEQNRLLNLQTLKLQNQTVTNQNLLIANQALVIAGLNTTEQNKESLITDSEITNMPTNINALQSKGLLHQILAELRAYTTQSQQPIDPPNQNASKNILNMTLTHSDHESLNQSSLTDAQKKLLSILATK